MMSSGFSGSWSKTSSVVPTWIEAVFSGFFVANRSIVAWPLFTFLGQVGVLGKSFLLFYQVLKSTRVLLGRISQAGLAAFESGILVKHVEFVLHVN